MPIFALNVPLSSNFLEEPSNLSHSIVLSTYLYCSLGKTFLHLFDILWNSAFKWVYLTFSPLLLASLFSQLFVRPPQTTILPFLHLLLGMVLITVSCTVLGTSIHSSSALYQSNPLNLFVTSTV